MNLILKRFIPCLLAIGFLFGMCGCSLFEEPVATSTAVPTTDARQAIDDDVSQTLRDFYINQLPSSVLKGVGVKAEDGSDVQCDYSMLKKSAFLDLDDDGAKEIVLLFDISAQTGKRGQNLAAFIDEKDGQPYVSMTDTASYGASGGEEANILTRYNGRICKVQFYNHSSYEAVLVDAFADGKWTTVLSAYKHIADHDGVKLESGSCYVDHSGGELYQAAIGKVKYSKEKFLNFRTPEDNFNNLVTNLLAETLLP